MQDYFLWNGVDCRTYGIHVTEQPPITIPLERRAQTNVPGRPGSRTQLEGDDVTYTTLATAVRDGVRAAFGVDLVPEPVWIGVTLPY